MGDLRVSTSAVWGARAGFAVGCLIAVVGVYLLFGLPVALVVAGVVVAVSSLVLVDVDEVPAAAADPEVDL